MGSHADNSTKYVCYYEIFIKQVKFWLQNARLQMELIIDIREPRQLCTSPTLPVFIKVVIILV